jgi:SAM-dependent methyltransferase
MVGKNSILMEEQRGTKCFICGSDAWLNLPSPHPNKSVTTSGVYVAEPLGKTQCARCGFVQRTDYAFLGLGDFYENSYATYYERPETYRFNKNRYKEIAHWVANTVGDLMPFSIVEVGCGRGWTLDAMKELFPQAVLEGIEPSKDNAEVARSRGYEILVGKLGAENRLDKKFDLVFSNHVLQHTTDPIEFLIGCKNILSDDGLTIHTVQDASTPTNELMFSDQNFSFVPFHLFNLVEKAGLHPLAWIKAPSIDSLMFSQMIVCAKRRREFGEEADPDIVRQWSPEKLQSLYLRRCEYMQAWSNLDEFLFWKTEKSKRVYNFGAGMFAFQISCYCPNYWGKVDACTIDGYDGKFIDKPVIALEELRLDEDDSLVLGVRPLAQRALLQRFRDWPCDVICWDNFIDG